MWGCWQAPSLAEQRRVVAKVDQLMALVDQLESQLAASRATAANLLEAIVAELTSSTVPTSSESVPLAAEDTASHDSRQFRSRHRVPPTIRAFL